jgi:hypothetical protein
MASKTERFITKWSGSGGAERANKDSFLNELCDALDVPRPDVATGDPAKDRYVFERGVRFAAEGESIAHGRIDLYKEGCFLLEAKQGSAEGSKKVGTAKRGTPAWSIAMQDAFGQALGYAKTFDKPPPFLIACDLGHCFDLYAAFDGTTNYRPFPNAHASRIFLGDLDKHAATLRAVMLDPGSLDPSKHSAEVTREVAGHLADLAKTLEKAGHAPDAVATFLMRCIFTMFAEDVSLLPEQIFTSTLAERWRKKPSSFPAGIEHLWRSMNEGVEFGFVGKLLRFNGGLFANPSALPLDEKGLDLLLEAAKCTWAEVDPAIFGTLLERALDPKERHRLGAHYTPRAYVERLVRPTIEEPIRADWDLVRAEVRQLVASATGEKVTLSVEEGSKLSPAELKKLEKLNKKAQGAKKDALAEAREKVRAFHYKLCDTKVLDPACGTGNFLYVTLAFFRALEDEVLALLVALGEPQESLRVDRHRVTPAQFLGIEVKRWAKEIAELVIWIGYLQAHFKSYGRTMPVPEPVLRDYKNIENRDAVLAWDDVKLVRDEKGKPVSRWDGETMKKSPITGEEIPDETARVPVYEYVNPRKAEWPRADFIVGNPPFLGKLKMLTVLGDGYVRALRTTYQGSVPDGVDFVMYWWHMAGQAVAHGQTRRFGLVTTNSISQVFNRRVVSEAMNSNAPIHLVFAIPDHPWVDTTDGADVRIAMTTAQAGVGLGRLLRIAHEASGVDGIAIVELNGSSGVIHADLRIGANVAGTSQLRSNLLLASTGLILGSRGFVLDAAEAARYRSTKAAESLIFPLRHGRDITDISRNFYVIDTSGWSASMLRDQVPDIYQRLRDTVYPERQTNRDPRLRENWWLFRRSNEQVRRAISALERFVVTPETAKHRVFSFLPRDVRPEHKLVVIGTDDAFVLGQLSSRAHVTWALATGGHLGVGNDPVYVKTSCFEKFPFPTCTEAQTARIRALGESLDAHRKARQAAHPDLTITGMYNVLEKLRSGEALTDKEKVIHERGLVSVLKQIHDELDAAVFEAYGWPSDSSDEQILEKLVALNAERAEEERNGLVRWLRPDFQNPSGKRAQTQEALVDTEPAGDEEAGAGATPAAAATKPWPKKLAEQIAALRDLVTTGSRAWSVHEVAQGFARAPRADVEEILDSFAALGLMVAYETERGRRWRVASNAGG